jgi:hypothetical protein
MEQSSEHGEDHRTEKLDQKDSYGQQKENVDLIEIIKRLMNS